jgi:Fe-S-cluster containining protein
MSPRRNLKTTGDGTRKAVELNKAVIKFKNTEHPCKNCPKHLCTSRTAGREIDRSRRKALKKITNAIKKTRNYTERDKR